jgi:hypothetical protein
MRQTNEERNRRRRERAARQRAKRAADRERKRKSYWKRKAAGICTHNCCQSPAGDTLFCARHAAMRVRNARARRPGMGTYYADKMRKLRRARMERGLCSECGRQYEDAGDSHMCMRCLCNARERTRKMRARRGGRLTTCTLCGGLGHREYLCPSRVSLTPGERAQYRDARHGQDAA